MLSEQDILRHREWLLLCKMVNMTPLVAISFFLFAFTFDLIIIWKYPSFQITNHKWAWPFMDPVDVKGLKLHDYYEVMF